MNLAMYVYAPRILIFFRFEVTMFSLRLIEYISGPSEIPLCFRDNEKLALK